MRTLLLSLLSIGVVCSAFANIREIHLDFPIQDPYLSSVWGYFKSGVQKIDITRYPQEELELGGPNFDKKLMVLLNKQKRAAPLAIFIPGVFSPTNRRQSKQMAKILLKLGYVVIRMPNTLSSAYLDAFPHHDLSNFMQSSNSYIGIIRQLKRDLQHKKIITSDKITILGVSHGAFLSTVIAAKAPELFQQAIILSPPINLLTSTQIIDQTIKENAQRINLGQLLRDLPMLIQLYFKDHLSLKEQIKFAPVTKDIITFGTFQQRLILSVEKFLQQRGKSSPFPSFWLNFYSSDYWKWRRQVQQLPLLKKFAHNSWQLYQHTDYPRLNYWLSELESSDVDFLVLSAKNDFINIGHHWPSTTPNLLLLSSGSHYGYRYQQWFYDFLYKLLKLPTK